MYLFKNDGSHAAPQIRRNNVHRLQRFILTVKLKGIADNFLPRLDYGNRYINDESALDTIR